MEIKLKNKILKDISKYENTFDYNKFKELVDKNYDDSEIKINLLNALNSCYKQISMDYSIDKFRDPPFEIINNLLLAYLNLIEQLENSPYIISQKVLWERELAKINKSKVEKIKYLKSANKIIKAGLKKFKNDFLLRIENTLNLIDWYNIGTGFNQKKELYKLLNQFLKDFNIENFNYLIYLFVYNLSNISRKTELTNEFFNKFIEISEDYFEIDPQLRVELILGISNLYYEYPTKLKNTVILNKQYNILIKNNTEVKQKWNNIGYNFFNLYQISVENKKTNQKLKEMAINVFMHLKNQFPKNVFYISRLVDIYSYEVIKLFNENYKNKAINNFNTTLYWIQESLKIDPDYQQKTYAGLIKKFNSLLFDNHNLKLNDLAISLYEKGISKDKDDKDMFNISLNDYTSLAECYILKNKKEKALKVIKTQQKYLKAQKEKWKYESYNQNELLKIPIFEPIYQQIKDIIGD